MSLNFGIIGCGRIAKRHAEQIKKISEINLIAVCDIQPDKADDLGDEYSAKIYYSVDALLKNEDLDIVSICSPNGLHAKHSIQCLDAGLNVLCEKPMAISTHDCGEMIKAAEKANKRLFVIKQNRFNPPVVAVKQLLENNKLGKVYSLQLSCFWNRNENYYENSWKGTKDLDGGTLFTQFSHFIDLLYYLNGDVKEVKAMGNNFHHKKSIEFEDTGIVLLKFQNESLGTINYTVNSFEKNMEGSLTIFGEKGTVKIGGQYLNELEYQSIDNYEIKNLPRGNSPNNYGEYKGSMSNHDLIYENVVDVLLKGGQIATNMFDGLKTVEIIEKIYASYE